MYNPKKLTPDNVIIRNNNFFMKSIFDNKKITIKTPRAILEYNKIELPEDNIDWVWMSTPRRFFTSDNPEPILVILYTGKNSTNTIMLKNKLTKESG